MIKTFFYLKSITGSPPALPIYLFLSRVYRYSSEVKTKKIHLATRNFKLINCK